jgi:transcriptional regulator with XRE-family HTH domain
MAAREDRYKDIDQNIAANLRTYREAGTISQEELAQRMTDRGFGFSQATIWKIESGQRPVRASELVALADSLGIMAATSLTHKPDAARHQVQLEQASRKAHHAYETLKEAAAGYLEAQFEVLVAAREAQDAGLTVTELHTSWLDTPPEEAVIQARVETDEEAARSEQVNDAVNKILDALRSNGYEPALRIEDVEVHGGPGPVRTPAQSVDATDTNAEDPRRQP